MPTTHAAIRSVHTTLRMLSDELASMPELEFGDDRGLVQAVLEALQGIVLYADMRLRSVYDLNRTGLAQSNPYFALLSNLRLAIEFVERVRAEGRGSRQLTAGLVKLLGQCLERVFDLARHSGIQLRPVELGLLMTKQRLQTDELKLRLFEELEERLERAYGLGEPAEVSDDIMTQMDRLTPTSGTDRPTDVACLGAVEAPSHDCLFAIERNRQPVGTGFLVRHYDRLVGVTCAHVLGVHQTLEGQTIPLKHFQQELGRGEASVLWHRPPNDQSHTWWARDDIAILSYPHDWPQSPLTLVDLVSPGAKAPLAGFRNCRSFAYVQRTQGRGRWLDRIDCATEVGDGFVELIQRGSDAIEEGASGAPLFYPVRTGYRVVGMIQARMGAKTAYLIPSGLILEVLARLDSAARTGETQ